MLKPAENCNITIVKEDYENMVAYFYPEKSIVHQETKVIQEEVDMDDAIASVPDAHTTIEMAKAESMTSTEREMRAYRRCTLCTKICFLVIFLGVMAFFMCFPIIFKKKQEEVRYLTEDDHAVLPNIPGKNDH